MKIHKDLDVFKLSHDLTVKMYKLTKKFPSEEKFGLVNQLRRTAYSIPMNISEGSGRFYKGEYKHFISIARGSAAEIIYQLELVKDLGYISKDEYDYYSIEYSRIAKMLTKLYRSLN